MLTLAYRCTVAEATDESVEEIAAFYRAVRGVNLPGRRFRWLYLENPAGPALLATCRDQNGHLIGLSAAIPHRVRHGYRICRAWYTTDLTVARAHRQLGLALSLRASLLEALAQQDPAFIFGCPDNKLLPLYRRLGPCLTVPNRRYVRLVSGTAWLQQHRGPRWLLAGARAVDRIVRGPSSGPFTDVKPLRWDELNDYLQPEARPFVVDPAYVRWRFASCPRYEHRAFGCLRKGTPLGWMVVSLYDGVAWIKAWDGSSPSVYPALCAGAVAWLAQQGIRTLAVVLPERHYTEHRLRRASFRQRPESSHTLWHPTGLRPTPQLWNRLVSDRDL